MPEENKEEKESKFSWSRIPLDKTIGIVDATIKAFLGYLDHRYKVEKRIDEFKEETERKAEELKADAIHSAYAVKKAFIRAIVEVILLSTGLLALIIGGVLLLDKLIGIEYVLVGYGLGVTLIVLFKMKMS